MNKDDKPKKPNDSTLSQLYEDETMLQDAEGDNAENVEEEDDDDFDDLEDREPPDVNYFSDDYDSRKQNPYRKIFRHFGSGIRYGGSGNFQFVRFLKANKQPSWGRTYNLDNPYCELYYRKYMSRFFYPYIKPSERIVLDFIVDRTIAWGKEWEKIRKVTFIKGMRNVTAGTGLTEPTINRTLNSLLEKRFIAVMDRINFSVDIDHINRWLIENNKGVIWQPY